MEMERVPEAGYPIIGLPVAGFDRKRLWRNAGGVLELTNGILRLTPDRRGFVTAAALLGWGGLSVHCQTAAVTAGSGISLRLYVPAKAVQAALSAGLAALLAPYLLP